MRFAVTRNTDQSIRDFVPGESICLYISIATGRLDQTAVAMMIVSRTVEPHLP